MIEIAWRAQRRLHQRWQRAAPASAASPPASSRSPAPASSPRSAGRPPPWTDRHHDTTARPVLPGRAREPRASRSSRRAVRDSTMGNHRPPGRWRRPLLDRGPRRTQGHEVPSPRISAWHRRRTAEPAVPNGRELGTGGVNLPLLPSGRPASRLAAHVRRRARAWWRSPSRLSMGSAARRAGPPPRGRSARGCRGRRVSALRRSRRWRGRCQPALARSGSSSRARRTGAEGMPRSAQVGCPGARRASASWSSTSAAGRDEDHAGDDERRHGAARRPRAGCRGCSSAPHRRRPERARGEDRGNPQSDEHALVAVVGEPQRDREEERRRPRRRGTASRPSGVCSCGSRAFRKDVA